MSEWRILKRKVFNCNCCFGSIRCSKVSRTVRLSASNENEPTEGTRPVTSLWWSSTLSQSLHHSLTCKQTKGTRGQKWTVSLDVLRQHGRKVCEVPRTFKVSWPLTVRYDWKLASRCITTHCCTKPLGNNAGCDTVAKPSMSHDALWSKKDVFPWAYTVK